MFNFLHGQMLKSFWVPLCSGSGGGGSGCHHSRDDCQEDGVTLPELLALWGKWRPSSTAEGTGQPRLVLATDSLVFFLFFFTGARYFFIFRTVFLNFPVKLWKFGVPAVTQGGAGTSPSTCVPALQTHFTSFSVSACF